MKSRLEAITVKLMSKATPLNEISKISFELDALTQEMKTELTLIELASSLDETPLSDEMQQCLSLLMMAKMSCHRALQDALGTTYVNLQ